MEKIAFLFPGQGAQFVGMGKSLFSEFAVARNTFEEANDVLGYDLQKICFEGSISELNKIENMLTAIMVVSIATFRVYMYQYGLPPALIAGHSLGEYSALACSGAIDFGDCLKIVYKRSLLAKKIAEMGVGGMTVVNGVNRDIVELQCRKMSNGKQCVEIACYNAPNQIVISGENEIIMSVEDELMRMNANITPIIGCAPFHSSLMHDAAMELKNELDKYTFYKFKWPVISNVTAIPYVGPEEISKNLVQQLTRTVQWRQTLNYIQEQGVSTAIEMGPQAVLTNLVTMNGMKYKALTFGQKNDRAKLESLLSSNSSSYNIADVSKKIKRQVPTVITRSLAVAVCTRNTNWNEEEYRKGVIEPYEKIEQIQANLEREAAQPTVEQMREALDMLLSVFKTKGVPKDIQVKRFKQIFDETGTLGIFNDFLKN